jgi:hypothetical protein
MKADDAGRAKARVWEGSESAEVEYEGNMSTNEARMCCKLFHFANILAALESGRTHVGIATESRDSDRILPRQSLGLSRSVIPRPSFSIGASSSGLIEGRPAASLPSEEV